MSDKYEYFMTDTGKTMRMRNGEIYDPYGDFPSKYKSIIDFSSSLFTTTSRPSDFFDMEAKEYIDKILNNTISKEDYKELLKEYKLLRKSAELQIALVEDKNTPADIIKEIAKIQKEIVKPHLLKRDNLDEQTLRLILNDINKHMLIAFFNSYSNKPLEIPMSQTALEYIAKHFAPSLQYKPVMYCGNEKLISNLLNETKNKALISTLVASNVYLNEEFRENVFFNIENDCDIFSVQNPTEKMCQERYESLISALDVENENKDPEIEKSLILSLNHLVSALENGYLSCSMQKDLFYQISTKDWKDDKYYNLINAMTRYSNDPSTLNNICINFVPHCIDDRLDPLYENKNTPTEALNSLINYHIDNAIILKDSPKYNREINKIKTILPRLKPTGILCENLLKLNDKTINLTFMSHSQIGILINKFSETKNPEEKLFYEIVKDRKLSNVAKKSLFKTFSDPKVNITFCSSDTGDVYPESTFGVIASTTGLLQNDVDSIKNFLDIHKSLIEDKKISQMITNYLEKIDIEFEKYSALHNLGFIETDDGMQFINEENPKIFKINKDEIKENLKHLSKCVVENIQDLFGDKFLSLKTERDCIRFYQNIDMYKQTFDILKEEIIGRETKKHTFEIDL